MSHHSILYRELLKENNVFAWNEAVNQVFQWFRSFMATAFQEPLQYFDWSKTILLQVDTSSRGFSTSFLQEGQPITFMSKSLTHLELYKHKKGVTGSDICMHKVSYIHLWQVIYSYK